MTMTLTVLSDERAMVARATENRAAFGPLYDHYYPQVYTYVRYRVQDRDAAEDVVAHIFERALERLETYHAERGPFGAWLFGIARRCVGSHYQAQRRRRWFSLDLLRDRGSDTPPPEELALVSESNGALLQALAQLRERDRDVVALKFAGRLTNREIAALTGLSESNVGVILYRALRQLRGLLTEEEPHV